MRAAIGVAAWAMVAGAAWAAPPALYAVGRVGSAIDDAETIGRQRAGFACLRNGMIHWHEFASGTQMAQRSVVQDALEDAGLSVTPLGAGADRALRLRATVQVAAADLCVRQWLWNPTGFSGTVTLGVEWRLEDPAGAPVVAHVSTIVRKIDPKQPAPLGAIYSAMLGEAARDAAAWLKSR